jgi:hypothetical protein
MATIRSEFADIPRWTLPRMGNEVVGLEALRELARMIAVESSPSTRRFGG